MDQLKEELGDKIVVQESDWNCTLGAWINHQRKPFDDVRVRRALVLALDHWGSAPALSQISLMHTAGSLVFPGSPLPPNKHHLTSTSGSRPDINQSHTTA